MRLYLIHRKYYLQYLQAQKIVEDILNEQERLLNKVQPKSTLAEHERDFMPSSPKVGGKRTNKAEEYAIEMERLRIKTRLTEAKALLQDRAMLLDQKEQELRKSRDIYNMIYRCKWVDEMKPEAIVFATGYSRSQVYSILGHLEKQLERGVNG